MNSLLYVTFACLVIFSTAVEPDVPQPPQPKNRPGGGGPNNDPPGPPQVPKWLDALYILRGGKDLTTEEQQDLLKNAVAGVDYPVNGDVPPGSEKCEDHKTPHGYYADVSEPSKCQAFHFCSPDGVDSAFVCPNKTLFNQITLICDWFFNVDCSKSARFADYSNRRLYLDSSFQDPKLYQLLDDQLVYPSTP